MSLIRGLHLLSILATLFCTATAYGQNPLELRRSIFKIRTTSQDLDFANPWRYQASGQSSGTGFYIGDNLIMTNAHVVANSRFITVQRDGDSEPVPALVKFIAHDSDLALLTVEKKDFFKKVTPMRFGSLPRLRSQIATIGYPMGGEQISITAGVVSRIGYRTYVHTGYHQHLLVQVDSAINPGNSGGPVVQDNLVVGVAFQAISQAEATGYIIPTLVIKRFLKDVEDGRYDGHPDDGMTIRRWAMSNAATAAFHGLSGKPRGVVVSDVAAWSPLRGKILPGDVILAMEGQEIGVDGRIDFQGERIDFVILYDQRQIGDKVTYDILRNEKKVSVEIIVQQAAPHYIPQDIYAKKPKYYIHGGLIFTTLTRNYLRSWGSKWYYHSPLVLRFADEYESYVSDLSTREDLVVLAGRLPDAVNTYAAGFEHELVDSMDGIRITSLRALATMLQSSAGEFNVLRFVGSNDILVLNRKDMALSQSNILLKYGVKDAGWFYGIEADGAVGQMP